MTVKKKYAVGDTVWIYGITNGKSTEGKIVQTFTIKQEGWNQDIHYVVAVPTEIEYLLEVRTWETISQTKGGRVGALREVFDDPDAAHRMLARTGMAIISTDETVSDGTDEDDPSTDEIHAALEKSQKDGEHGPLVTNPAPRKRQYFKKKKL